MFVFLVFALSLDLSHIRHSGHSLVVFALFVGRGVEAAEATRSAIIHHGCSMDESSTLVGVSFGGLEALHFNVFGGVHKALFSVFRWQFVVCDLLRVQAVDRLILFPVIRDC